MLEERARRVRAGHQHGGEWSVEIGIDRLGPHQRREDHVVAAGAQPRGAAQAIGLRAGQQNAHLKPRRNQAARGP